MAKRHSISSSLDQMMATSVPDMVLANIAVALAAFIQASSGIGFAMIAVPLLALIDLGMVPGPSLFAMLGLSALMTVTGWQDIDRRGLAALLPGLCAGTAIGAMLLGALPAAATGLLFGSMILIALIVGQIGIVPSLSRLSFAVTGVVAGLMGTVAGIHGPALAVLYQRAETRTVRATIALIFVIASSLSLLSLYVSQLFDRDQLLTGLALWPGAAAGLLLAIRAQRLLSDKIARRIMLCVATMSALLLIVGSFE